MGAFAVLRKVLLQMVHWMSLALSFYGGAISKRRERRARGANEEG